MARKTVKKRSTKVKHNSVTDVLRKELEGMKAFAPLPGERELAKRFGVTTITIRKSLRSLEEERRVFSVHRKGTFVAKTMQLAVFQPSIYDSVEVLFRDSFYRPIYTILEDRKSEYNWDVHYIIKENPQMTYPAIDRRALRTFDGIVSIGIQDEEYTAELEAIGLPVVVVDFHPALTTVDAVSVDGRRAGARAAEILMNHGHRLFVFVGHNHSNRRDTDAVAMEEGVRYMLELKGMGVPDVYYPVYSEWKDLDAFVKHLCVRKKRPTGFITTGYGNAMSVASALAANGFEVPHDAGIICLSIDEDAQGNTDGFFASLRFSLTEMGGIAVESMLQLLSGRSTGRQVQIIPRYVEGRSIAEVS